MLLVSRRWGLPDRNSVVRAPQAPAPVAGYRAEPTHSFAAERCSRTALMRRAWKRRSLGFSRVRRSQTSERTVDGSTWSRIALRGHSAPGLSARWGSVHDDARTPRRLVRAGPE